jgi:hypothetical protein
MSKITTEIFVEKAKAIHGDKYDYSKSEYVSTRVKLIIICPIHGEFSQTPEGHTSKKFGCKACAQDFIGELLAKDVSVYIKQCNDIHNFKYDYSKIEYKNAHSLLEIVCPIHGSFSQEAAAHLRGQGCPICGDIKAGFSKMTGYSLLFIDRANIVHSHKYDYSKSVYTGNMDNIEIICPDHGSFFQTPGNHLQGKGCSKCHSIISKLEVQWLDILNIPEENRHKLFKINGRIIKVDAYDPITNTIYEFYGDYWHGNPNVYPPHDLNDNSKKTFGELYQLTIERELFLKSEGFNINTIWENDFKNAFQN